MCYITSLCLFWFFKMVRCPLTKQKMLKAKEEIHMMLIVTKPKRGFISITKSSFQKMLIGLVKEASKTK